MSESSLLHDLDEAVHCAICFDLLDQPEALRCLHTFCHKCLQQIARRHKITCPTCRTMSYQSQVKSDFKTKHLVELYKKQASVPVTDFICDLCEDHEAEFQCYNCQRFLCSGCRKAHLKMSGCRPDQSFLLKDLIKEKAEQLSALKESVCDFEEKLNSQFEECVKFSKKAADDVLEIIDNVEDDLISKVKEWHEKQRHVVLEKLEEHCQERRATYETSKKTVQELSCELSDFSTSAKAMFSVHPPSEKIKRELEKIDDQTVSPFKLMLKNEDGCYSAFDSSKALVVEVKTQAISPIMNLSEKSTIATEIFPPGIVPETFLTENNFSGCLPSFLVSPFHVEKLSKLTSVVFQMQFLQGNLWVLMWDHIEIYWPDGSLIKTLEPGFSYALDMCVSGSGHVIIASKKCGLLQLTLSGQMVRCIAKGRFWSVTNDHNTQSVWAVKQEQDDVVCVYNFSVSHENCLPLVRFETDLRSKEAFYCALMGNSLYLCSFAEAVVYAVDIRDGKITSKCDFVDGLSETCSPKRIYSDPVSQCLLITDCKNDKLLLFYPEKKQWNTIAMPEAGGRKWPTAVATDKGGNMWIASGYSPYFLFKSGVVMPCCD